MTKGEKIILSITNAVWVTFIYLLFAFGVGILNIPILIIFIFLAHFSLNVERVDV